MAEKNKLDEDEQISQKKRSPNRRHVLSGFLNFGLADITGKLTSIVLFAALTFGLFTEANSIRRSTGLEYWQQATCLMVFAWALWLWFMTDREHD